MNKDLLKRVEVWFEELGEWGQVRIYNEWCGSNNYFDDMIYNVDELGELFDTEKLINLLLNADKKGEWWTLNGYGWLVFSDFAYNLMNNIDDDFYIWCLENPTLIDDYAFDDLAEEYNKMEIMENEH